MPPCRLVSLVLVVTLVLAATAHAQIPIEVLHTFSARTSPGHPTSLIQAGDGTLYGTTTHGGPFAKGTVFRLTTTGSLTVVHSFNGTDGAEPLSILQSPDGRFYGLAESGGSDACGTVWRMTSDGRFSMVHSFLGGEGCEPTALIQAQDGDFYGTMARGGPFNSGTIFRMSADGAVAVVHAFTGGSGSKRPDKLLQAADGSFYGTTVGDATSPATVFRMIPGGPVTRLRGLRVYALIQGDDGYFYGAENATPSLRVFRASADFTTLTFLHAFNRATDGSSAGALVHGLDTRLYGTTSGGGANNGGTLFRIGAGNAFDVLHAFGDSPTDGRRLAPILRGQDGNIYGFSEEGGAGESGTVFKVAPDGTYSVLYVFTNGPEGLHPVGDLAQGSNGLFYGATAVGGPYDRGTIFSMTPAGAINIIHAFSGVNDGGNPFSGLVEGPDGNFYGSSNRAIFRVTPDGNVTQLHTFNDDDYPRASLMLADDGNLYGTTGRVYPANPENSVFRITPSGVFTTLHVFDRGIEGVPSRLVQAADGKLYGRTSGSVSGGGLACPDMSSGWLLMGQRSRCSGTFLSPGSGMMENFSRSHWFERWMETCTARFLERWGSLLEQTCSPCLLTAR